MTKGFIKHPSDMFSVGQLVKVYVYKVDLVKQKLQLTMFKNEE
jgi:transcriptional accessory protein Tex/SPT6